MSKDIYIINNDEEEIKKFHERGWGARDVLFTKEHIESLLEGKCIGLDDGEYTTVIKYSK